jgi:hypothetical protein
VASAVRDLAPGQRRELAEPLRRYERLLRDQDRFGLWWRRQPGLAVAGAAVLPGAAVLAPWLARNSLSRYMPGLYHRTVTDLVLDVLRARDAPWLGDLAGRLAGRLTTRSVDADLWQLVSDLVTLAGELNTPEAWHGSDSRAGWMSCWPLMLPAHRDVAAAHLVPHLAGWTRSGRGGAALLPALADADGPVADGMNLAVAYGLGATDRADRAAAVDAMITLAARGQLDGAALGRQVGTLTARGDLLLNRVVPGLRDVANAGAPGPVWALVAAALPQLLPPAGGQPPHRLAALVELGVDLVDTCRPAATLPCLEPVVAQRGASQLVTQARRLRQALSRSASAP